jgi:putative Ca2+/H+ antiporter (TMEM165/GDT1 family)
VVTGCHRPSARSPGPLRWVGETATGIARDPRSRRSPHPPGTHQPEGPVDALLVSFVVIFVAELGDKSQLMALAFATRYRPLPILVGITVATGLVHAVSVLVGGLLGASLPADAINVVAGVAFFGFAAWTLRGDDLDQEEANPADRHDRTAMVAAGVAFFLAELGDKTMLATIALATTEGLFGTWVGSTLGMVASDALAIVVGARLGRRLPERVIRIGVALSFVLFGLLLVAEGLS